MNSTLRTPTAPLPPPPPGSGHASGVVVHSIDDCDVEQFLRIAASYGHEKFGYVVTPNVDHLVRYHEDARFRALYRDASYVLMDSRVCARLLRLLRGVRLPVCTGSELSLRLLQTVVTPSDRIVFIGGSAENTARLASMHALKNIRHYDPPMKFVEDASEVEKCLRFIEAASPFRFCFLAVGSPQQEIIAHELQRRGQARGLALCVGAALNFATGFERRAPVWLQQLSLEWLHRLLLNPRRMARRYLIRGPRIFAYLPRAQFELRHAETAVQRTGVGE